MIYQTRDAMKRRRNRNQALTFIAAATLFVALTFAATLYGAHLGGVDVLNMPLVSGGPSINAIIGE